MDQSKPNQEMYVDFTVNLCFQFYFRICSIVFDFTWCYASIFVGSTHSATVERERPFPVAECINSYNDVG